VTKLCNARPGLPPAGSHARRPALRAHPGGLAVRTPPAAPQPGTPASDQPGHGTPPATGAASPAAGRHRTADRAAGWLRGAMLALAVLAGAAAAVSWDAQYVLVRAVKHNPAIAALEAGIPDIGAVIFAALGIALALHGRRAIRARTLNVACVGISLAMNALASAPGWRDLAIWVMPSAIYALASDTLIGVVRAWVIARARHTGQALADDEPTPMAAIGGAVLWLIRLALAPVSTIAGFRRWVIDECPAAPGRTAPRPRRRRPVIAQKPDPPGPPDPPRQARPGKQDRLLALAGERHDLSAIPLKSVSKLATGIAAEIGLAPGTARRVLLGHVRALQNGQHNLKETS
jgi:hypothetical protein